MSRSPYIELSDWLKNKSINVTITKKLGNSANGVVFNTDRPVVLKLVRHPMGQQEAAFQKRAARANVAPKVRRFVSGVTIPHRIYKRFIGKGNLSGNQKFDVIIMNHLKIRPDTRVVSLYQYLESNANRVAKNHAFDLFTRKTARLHRREGIMHGNLHLDNVYVILDASGKIVDMKIIDYGRSSRMGQNIGRVTSRYAGKEALFVSPRGTLRTANNVSLLKARQWRETLG